MIYCLIALAAVVAVMLMPLFGSTSFHLHKKPNEEKIRIACVGDSITNGALIPWCFSRSYPAQLQRLMGKQYQVENFGVNDRTLQDSGDKPYSAESEYRRSLAFVPNIVVVMLGTNDTKEINWESKERFQAEYENFLKPYADLKTAPQIILCTPSWGRNPSNSWSKLTNDTRADYLPPIAEVVRQVASHQSLALVDLYSIFQGREDLLSYDGVHPNSKGDSVIAKHVAEKIKA